ncbi:hypothetical protein GXP73_02390 [Leuconostoc lactis]|uniref:hypothetical protein n=1 Tax=Leuconostoc lactis TaxID=1246 RepID=UPI0015F54BDD|nr:hypothetical protein [Leuconostoc lactis]MBA5812981.1 hypothetical protein [Leuconostoc lactis]
MKKDRAYKAFSVGIILMILFIVGSIANGRITYYTGISVLIIFIFFSKGRIPTHNLFFPYYPLFIYGIIISIIIATKTTFSARDFLVGIIDFANPILFIMIGAILTQLINLNNFFKYLIFSGTFVSIFQLLLLALNINTADSINSLRMSMLPTPNIIPLVMVLLIYRKVLNIEITKGIGTFAFLVVLISFIATLSRTLILEFLVYILLFSLSNKFFKKNMLVYLIVISGSLLTYTYLSASTLGNAFIEKIVKSITEMSSGNDWNQLSNILDNWRGYEVFSAKNQINSMGMFERIFGEGLASKIFVGPYAMYVGVDSMSIPYLHNSFYTILVKLGYFGVVYYCAFLIMNFLYFLNKSKLNPVYLLVPSTIVVLALNSKLMQGVIIMGHDSILLVVLGYLSSYIMNRQRLLKNRNRIKGLDYE